MDNELTDNELETLEIDEQREAELRLLSGTLSRDEIPDEYKWRLSDLYESDDAWQDAYDSVRARLPKFEEYHGRLDDSPDVLLDFLRFGDDICDEADKLATYATLKHNEDLSIGKYLTMKRQADELCSNTIDMLIPLAREINSIGTDRLNAWLDATDADSDLKEYRTLLDFIAKLEIDEPEAVSKETDIAVSTIKNCGLRYKKHIPHWSMSAYAFPRSLWTMNILVAEQSRIL